MVRTLQCARLDSRKRWIRLGASVMSKSTAAASPADATNSPTVQLERLDQGA